MNDKLNMGQSASVELVRPSHPADQLSARGRFTVEHWRNGAKIADYELPNSITNEGRTLLLNTFFNAATQIAAAGWYMGLVDNSGFSTFQVTDAYANLGLSGNSWVENTAYSLISGSTTARPAWGPGTAAVPSGSTLATITNASTVVFNINASGNIQGLFICGGNDNCANKTNPNGSGQSLGAGSVLWSAAAFTTAPVAVQNGDQLKVTYTVTA